ncbi:MAG: endonuclease/exonuclease/phosphatase family protein [Ktedonobacteraceae bacterium]
MTRILSYNILVGATRRVNQLTSMLQPAQADIIGLVEANDPNVVDTLAERLGMQAMMSARGENSQDWQVALLTRLPVVYSKTYPASDVLFKPVLEVCVEEENGQQLTIFVTHLSAAFSKRRAGDNIRRREIQEVLHIMAHKHGTPHLLMGDFNSLAPGDAFHASNLLRYLVNIDKHYRKDSASVEGHPYLNFVVPASLRIFNPLLRIIPNSKLLTFFFDRAAAIYAPRGAISLLSSAGYVDCFRRANLSAPGFTCPAAAPAGRIDYIFASLELAGRLDTSTILTSGENVTGDQASDHLPVLAEFGAPVNLQEITGDSIPDSSQHACSQSLVNIS